MTNGRIQHGRRLKTRIISSLPRPRRRERERGGDAEGRSQELGVRSQESGVRSQESGVRRKEK
ncbi:hypothetical protein V0288_12770 [Pannus brasiliensis CCIBt3594]|uniref:Uncharacterized protein n=1 Tax=Pannus brasiliensis CCIBt3594 TaxID=1427578 RepID=A0AAW9QY33_9CHRO